MTVEASLRWMSFHADTPFILDSQMSHPRLKGNIFLLPEPDVKDHLLEESAGVEPARGSRHRLRFSKPACCRSSNSPCQPEELERVERSKPISRTCPLSRREGLPHAQQLHHDRGEREDRTPVALFAPTSAFQAGTLPLGHLSMEELGRVERP